MSKNPKASESMACCRNSRRLESTTREEQAERQGQGGQQMEAEARKVSADL